MKKSSREFQKSVQYYIFIIFSFILSVSLFIFSHPNFVIQKGIWGLAWFQLVPILLVLNRLSYKETFFYGFLYGCTICVLYSFWFADYYFVALVLVAMYEGILYGIVFFLLKKAEQLFKDYCFFIQCLIWCSFEYLRTLGFLGISYGVIGYSQWNNLVLLQSAALFGVHGINFLVIFPSCYLVSFLKYKGIKKDFLYKYKIGLFGYLCFLIILTVYGIIELNRPTNFDMKKRICLVQNNIDTQIYYTENKHLLLESYKQLIEDSIKGVENIDLIAFPESAVRPRILLNKEDSITDTMYQDVIEYLNFFYSLKVPILFGSGSFEYDSIKDGVFTYRAYNTSCFLENKKQIVPPEIQVYKKRHLVPIIEKIPFVNVYQKKYSSFSDCLSSGKEIVVFNLGDISFCTPVCFEESFAYDVRAFMKENPSFILSISSDLWNKSLVCRNQQMAMEVFRAVENRIPFLRASVTGQTVYINPKGVCEQKLEPFSKGVLICDVLVCKNPQQTLYTKTGDVFAVFCLVLCIFCFINKYINNLRKERL